MMIPGYRPPTAEEAREDHLKREAALDRAEADGSLSERQVAAARAALMTFAGYPRPIEPPVSTARRKARALARRAMRQAYLR